MNNQSSTGDKYEQIMEDLIVWVTHFDSGFPDRIQAASEEKIDRLEHLAGQKLPPTYRAFLRRFGEDHGGLNIAPDGTTKIDRVLQYYENGRKYGDLALSPGCFWIGSAQQSFRIGLMEKDPRFESEVVFLDIDDEVVGLYSESLPKLLFRTAFDKYRWREFAATACYSASFEEIGSRDRMKEVAGLAHSLDFRSLWFSDPHGFCGEKAGEAAISISQFNTSGMDVIISASSREEARRMGSVFTKALSVEFDNWRDISKAIAFEAEQNSSPL